MVHDTSRDMIFQLHWQHRLDFDKCIFVAQAGSDDFSSMDELGQYFAGIIKNRFGECPEDYSPMICNEDYEHFVRAVSP